MGKRKIEKLINKNLLVGLAYVDHKDNLIERKEIYGMIERINKQEGIVIKLKGSDGEFRLPPDINNIQEAAPGTYTLQSTGEVIVNPDYLCYWTVTKPKPE